MSGYDEMVERLRFESQRLMDGPVEYLQRLVVAELLSDAADVMEKQAQLVDRLAEECKAWMNGVADVVEPLGYDRGAACGPSDLLPGLTELRVHGLESARRLSECVEARSYLYEQVVDLSARLDEAKRIADPDPQPNPFDEHTRMWEDEIRGMGLNPDHVKKIAAEAKPYVDVPFGDVRGVPAFDPEVLEDVRRFYENNGREKQ